MKKLTSPPVHRLTLTNQAFLLFAKGAKKISMAIQRPDGKVDVAVSFSFMDYLKSAALPKENLSDTLVRIKGPKATDA